ncbi:MAG: hypothetical protein LBB94_03815 [Clostridiales bacterium]|jgi:hypothetical protein|nr:hypothetical protein [Clostridiales bacterium]
MTVWFLLDDLKTRIAEELKDFRLKNETGERVPVNIYLQNLPASEPDKDESIFPYVVIRAMQAADISWEEAYADVMFIAGVFDDATDYQGYKDVMNIQEHIRQNLCREHMVNERYEMVWPLNILPSDDFSDSAYPYFFGAVDVRYKIPVIPQDLRAFD